MHNDRAVVIFSGGQDSTTCLYWAMNRFKEVYAILFEYGQKHSIEIEQARRIAGIAGIDLKLIPLPMLKELSSSAMVHHDKDIGSLNEKQLPDSFVPNRNQLFITLSHAYAQMLNSANLVTGVCQTDYSGYPDCRQEFIDAIALASNIGSMSDIHIHTPLMSLTKAETFRMAKDEGALDIVIRESHTCYNGVRRVLHDWGYGCGSCPACKLRMNGFNEAKNNLWI